MTLLEVYRNEGNFFSIQSAIYKSELQYPSSQLVKGNVVRGSFRSQYNNLGWVGIRFTTHFRINEDTLEFRLKQAGENNWYYRGFYKTDQFQPDQIFPFGFPVIANSKNKAYVFEIESLDAAPGNGVSINSHFPVAVSSYALDKQYYLSAFGSVKNKYVKANPQAGKDLLLFIANKTYAILVLGQYTDAFLLYVAPIPIYLFWYWLIGTLSPHAKQFISSHRLIAFVIVVLALSRIFIFKSNSSFYAFLIFSSWITGTILYRSSRNAQTRNFIEKHRSLIFIIPFLMIIKALLITRNQDNITMCIVLLWFSSIVIYKIKNVINFYLSLAFLVLSALFYYLGQPHLAEQAAAWVIVAFGFAVANEFLPLIRPSLFLHAK